MYSTHSLCIFLSLIFLKIAFSQGVKEETEPVSDKTRELLDLLTKLNSKTSRTDMAFGAKIYFLSPEEQKYLDFRRTTDVNDNLYETTLPYLIAKHGNLIQSKTKKNSEMNRGLLNALNHMDMFNAGKRNFH